MKIFVQERAERDIQSAFAWYEEQARGLGDSFAEDVRRTFLRLSQFPRSGHEDKNGFLHAVMLRFPYTMFYTIESEKIVIYTVSHQHSEPTILRRGQASKS